MNTTEREREPGKKKKPATPIIDGDARPDINLHPEDDLKKGHPIETPKDKEKFTKNRVDRNSLEDYKDARD